MTSVFINEFHYDNTGTDTGEFIEIAGPAGTDLTGWSIVLYNGNGGAPYDTQLLNGTIADQGNGFGTVVVNYPSNGIQNGSPDGIALVDDTGAVIQFLSYEGSFTGVGGPANGLTSTDIGVNEPGSDPVGLSLQLTGSGTVAADFTWTAPAAQTPGAANNGQTFGGGGGPATTVVINEIDADQEGTDAAEFIELFDGGAGNTSLDGLVLVLYNGNGDVAYDAIALDGQTTNADGFFVVGSALVPNVDLVAFTTDGLQNGADAVALYIGNAEDFPDGTPVTNSGLLDAVVYGTNDPDDLGLLDILTPGESQANDTTPESLQRLPNGSGAFQALTPTPGTENEAPPPPVDITPIYEIQGASQVSAFVLAEGQTVAEFFETLPANTLNITGDSVTTAGVVTAVDTNGFYLQDPTGDGNIATSDAIFVFTSSAPSVAVGASVQVSGTVAEFFPGDTDTRNLPTTQLTGVTVTALAESLGTVSPTLIGAGGRVPPNTSIDDDAFGEFDPVNDGIDFFESLEGMLVTAQDLVAVAGTNGFGEIFAVVDNGTGATGISDRGTLNISPTDFNPERIQIDEDTGIFDFEFPDVNVGDTLGDVTGVVSYSFGNFEIIPTVDFTPNIGSAGLQPESTSLEGTNSQLTLATYNVLNLDPNDGDGDTDVADGRLAAIATQIVNNLNTPDVIGLQEIQDNNGSVNDSITSASETLQALVDAIAAAGGPTYAFIDNTFITDDANGGQPGGNIRTAFLYNPDRVGLVPDSVQAIGDQLPGSPFNGSRLPLVATFEFNGSEVTVVNNHFSSKGGSAPILGIEQDFAARQEDPTVNGSLDERREQAQAVNNFVDGLLANDATANVVVLGDLNEFEFVSPLQILEGTLASSNGGQDTVAGGDPVLTNLINSLPEDERYSFNFQGNSQQLDHILISNALAAEAEVDIVHLNSEFADSTASDHDPVIARLTLNQAPTAIDDTLSTSEITTVTVTAAELLANDSDPDQDPLELLEVSNAINGVVDFNPNTGEISFTPAADFTGAAQFDYTITDGKGGTDTATVIVNVGVTVDLGDGSDVFDGTPGNDRVEGGDGPDLLFGQAGDDQLSGGKGFDLLDGGTGDDTLLGGNGADVLNGGAGDDVIVGGRGFDWVSGGEGQDTFGFDRFDRTDTITDFEVGADLIDFSAIFADPRYGSATPFTDYVQVVQQGSNTAVQIDLNGDFGRFDRFSTFAVLQNVFATTVTEASFVL